MAGFGGVKTKLGAWVLTTPEGKRPEGALPADAALWSGAPAFPEPPAVGARVIVRGGFGASTVVGYYVEHGYLGIALRPDERPEWHLRQNPDRDVILMFGKELEGPEMAATAPEWRHRDGQTTAHVFAPGASLSMCSAVERERTTPETSRARCKRCERAAAGGPRSKLARGLDQAKRLAMLESRPAIDALRNEAETAGDAGQVALCDQAIKGDIGAWEACMDAIKAAKDADTDHGHAAAGPCGQPIGHPLNAGTCSRLRGHDGNHYGSSAVSS